MAGSSLKLHHQIRPPYFLQRPLHPPSHFPLQLQPHFPVPKSRQPSLKILLILHGFSRRNLCHPSPKPLVLPRFPKRTVHARRTHLQDVARARNQLLHIQDHAELLADTLAIRMANSQLPTLARLRWRQNQPRRVGHPRPSFRHPIDDHAQEALLPHLPLNIIYFQAFRPRHALGGFPNFFQIQPKTPQAMPGSTALQPAQQKSGLAPTHPCDLLQSENTVYSALKSNARYAPKSTEPFPDFSKRGSRPTLAMSLSAQAHPQHK